jgi:hypothetical protein
MTTSPRPARPSSIVGKWGIVTIIVAVAAVVVPLPRSAVERWYSTGLYTLLQPTLTFASNASPFSLLDALVIALTLIFLCRAIQDLTRASWWSGTVRIVMRAAIWGTRLYLAFLVLWGLNYQRQRLAERLAFDRTAVTEAAAARLAAVSIDRLNALHATAHAEGWLMGRTIDPALAGAFDRVTHDLGAPRRVVVGRPKSSVLDWYFQRAGVAGMTDPFFLETLLAGDLLPFERPFVIAHEWSHLAGLADEGEANVAGWLTCLRGSPGDQYSGWLFMQGEALRVLPRRDQAALAARLSAGPRADLRAIRERLARHISPRISSLGWRVYDSYLKANRVEAGTASYDEALRLALGLRLVPSM